MQRSATQQCSEALSHTVGPVWNSPSSAQHTAQRTMNVLVRGEVAGGDSSYGAPSPVRRQSKQTSEGTVLTPRYAFGVTGPVRDNVGVVTIPDSRSDSSSLAVEYLVHPIGQQIGLYRVEDGSMQFFSGRAKNVREVLAMTVSPNKRSVAVCERVSDAATGQVSVYSASDCKRIRTLTHPLKGDFVSCAFSGDGKLLAAVGASDSDSSFLAGELKEAYGVCTQACV